MSSWVRGKIVNSAFKALGSVGQLVEALLRPTGKSITKDIEQEIDAAAYLLKQFGFDVSKSKPSSPTQQPEAEPGTQFPTRRRISNIPDDLREFPENKPAIEGPIEVVSSNVHSIAYQWNLANGIEPGNLLVRYLGGSGTNRVGPGALYSYKHVPYEIFKAFKIASSKGAFVWDELRVRGTVSGHQFDYQLEDIGELTRVPRQAGLKRGQQGEFFMPRTLRGQRSTLPERQVRGSRASIPGYENASKLKFRSDSR
jgi:hypothetical protein